MIPAQHQALTPPGKAVAAQLRDLALRRTVELMQERKDKEAQKEQRNE